MTAATADNAEAAEGAADALAAANGRAAALGYQTAEGIPGKGVTTTVSAAVGFECLQALLKPPGVVAWRHPRQP